MNYEITEDVYDFLLKKYNEWGVTYYQLFGEEGISGNDIGAPDDITFTNL
tara:strand:+ start:3479 stop:3628 length:150 start_codon:yes stop_codon:yes gene_type:complete